jgi:hypothetical protein
MRKGMMPRIIAVLMVLFFAAPAFFVAAPAAAYRPPLGIVEWDDESRLTLARAMVGEADWHEPDHVAIAHVLARRWRRHQLNNEPISFARYIERYSASLRGDSERATWIRSLPWGPLPGAPYEQRWNRVQKLVRAFGEGRVKDPCPLAMHWGGTMDRPAQSWHPVSCGMTRNIFYTHRERLAAKK